MADERTKPLYNQPSTVPAAYAWPTLVKKDGDDLFDHYRHTLENLGNEKGLLGLIFAKSQNKFQDPAKLRRLIVDLIDTGEWRCRNARQFVQNMQQLERLKAKCKKCTLLSIWVANKLFEVSEDLEFWGRSNYREILGCSI